MEFHPFSSPSTPLRLCGFLTGDTVQVQGDTGDLQFSVQFNIQRKENPSPNTNNIPEVENVGQSVDESAYLTPTPTRQNQLVDENANANLNSIDAYAENEDANAKAVVAYVENGETSRRSEVVTRLRSGALTPLKYNNPNGRLQHHTPSTCRSGNRTKDKPQRRRLGYRSGNTLNKMLKRRNLPVRPCNSYAFFLIDNWSAAKGRHAPFVETSKKLSNKWFKLPKDKKKEYEDMASRDNARYKRQCMLLKNDTIRP